MTGIFKLNANHCRKEVNINMNKHCHNMPGGEHAEYILIFCHQHNTSL